MKPLRFDTRWMYLQRQMVRNCLSYKREEWKKKMLLMIMIYDIKVTFITFQFLYMQKMYIFSSHLILTYCISMYPKSEI